jgi:hypothetical protein
LAGRSVRPRPMVPITLIGPKGYLLRDAKLDTSADDTVFPDSFAGQIGIDLPSRPSGFAAGTTGTSIPIRYASVELRLTDGTEERLWPAIVAFGRVQRPLLGFAGCLQFFTATFFGDLEQIELTINRLYPGI